MYIDFMEKKKKKILKLYLIQVCLLVIVDITMLFDLCLRILLVFLLWLILHACVML